MLKWINRLTCTAVQFADDGTEKLIPKMNVPAFMSIQDGCYCPSCVALRVIANSNCWRCSSSIGINRCYEVEAYVIGGTVPPIFGKRYYHLKCWEKTCQERTKKQAEVKPSITGNFDADYLAKVERAYQRTKEALIARAIEKNDDHPIDIGGCCLFWAIYGAHELEKEGIQTMLQAGSMLWTVVPPSRIKEVPVWHPFNYGYQFGEPNQISIDAIKQGSLPEIHIWLGDSKNQTMIDFSTAGIKNHFKYNLGPMIQWLTPDPPRYLIVKAGTSHEELDGGHGVMYKIDSIAVMLAVHYGLKLTELRPYALQVPEKMMPIVERSQLLTVKIIQTKIKEAGEKVAEQRRAAYRVQEAKASDLPPLPKDSGRLFNSLRTPR